MSAETDGVTLVTPNLDSVVETVMDTVLGLSPNPRIRQIACLLVKDQLALIPWATLSHFNQLKFIRIFEEASDIANYLERMKATDAEIDAVIFMVAADPTDVHFEWKFERNLKRLRGEL